MAERLLLLTLLLFVQLVFAQSNKQDIEAIKNSRLASNEAIARHNIDGISKYWLPDFVQTIGRGITTTGKEAVLSGWKELFKTNKTVTYIRTPTTVTVGDNGIMAWEPAPGQQKIRIAKAVIIQLCGEKQMACGCCRPSCLCH